jgi:hypothetical protein
VKPALILVLIPDDMTDGEQMVKLPPLLAPYAARWVSAELVRDENAFRVVVEQTESELDK